MQQAEGVSSDWEASPSQRFPQHIQSIFLCIFTISWYILGREGMWSQNVLFSNLTTRRHRNSGPVSRTFRARKAFLRAQGLPVKI